MKIFKFIIIICLILFLCSCNRKSIKFSFNDIDNCVNKAQFLLELDGRKVYTYCIDDVNVIHNGVKEKLESFILNDNDSIDEIISSLKLKDVLSDGGTKIYNGGNISLIKCNTLDGNKDIYIGNKNMKLKSNFCDHNNYTFVRTYTIKDISEFNGNQYTDDGIPFVTGNAFEVVLSQHNGETKKVILNNIWNIKLEKGKTYEFELQLYNESENIEDTIEYIFKNSNIVEIRKTDKVGLEQLQEPIISD